MVLPQWYFLCSETDGIKVLRIRCLILNYGGQSHDTDEKIEQLLSIVYELF